MTDPKEKIRFELAEYVSMEEHLTKEDRLKILNAIFEKAFVFEKSLHIITEVDILNIAGMSKMSYSELSIPLRVGNKDMGYDDLRTIAYVEAFIAYMNSNFLSRREMNINYKEVKNG
jgi:hypothetical protein